MRDFFIAIGLTILQGLSQIVWDSFWKSIFDSVVYAEKKWVEHGRGEAKKQYVIDEMTKWLIERNIRKWYNKRFIDYALNKIVDEIIREANKKAGHNWADNAEELRDYLASRIPFIK